MTGESDNHPRKSDLISPKAVNSVGRQLSPPGQSVPTILLIKKSRIKIEVKAGSDGVLPMKILSNINLLKQGATG